MAANRRCQDPLQMEEGSHLFPRLYSSNAVGAGMVRGLSKYWDLYRVVVGRYRHRLERFGGKRRRLAVHCRSSPYHCRRPHRDRCGQRGCNRYPPLSIHLIGDRQLGGRRPEYRKDYSCTQRKDFYRLPGQLHPWVSIHLA